MWGSFGTCRLGIPMSADFVPAKIETHYFIIWVKRTSQQKEPFLEELMTSTLGIISKLFIPKVKRNGFSFLFDFKIRSTISNDLSVTETFLRNENSFYNEIAKKALQIRYKTVP
jgi:hypothetical protein